MYRIYRWLFYEKFLERGVYHIKHKVKPGVRPSGRYILYGYDYDVWFLVMNCLSLFDYICNLSIDDLPDVSRAKAPHSKGNEIFYVNIFGGRPLF